MHPPPQTTENDRNESTFSANLELLNRCGKTPALAPQLPEQNGQDATPKPTPSKPTIGRPPILTEDLKRQAVVLVRAGCTQRRAAELMEIDEATIRKAAQKDPAFAPQLAKARADLELDVLAKVNHAAAHSWHAAAWLLKRASPARYDVT